MLQSASLQHTVTFLGKCVSDYDVWICDYATHGRMNQGAFTLQCLKFIAESSLSILTHILIQMS